MATAGSLDGERVKDQRVRLDRKSEFQQALRARVDQYFEEHGGDRSGGRKIVRKSAVIFAWVLASWGAFLLLQPVWWATMLLAVSCGLGMAGIGFSVQHDGGHRAYSRSPRVNKIAAAALEFIGGSTWAWRHRHNVVHHTYPNIADIDHDIDLQPWARTTHQQPIRAYQRYQHLHIWPLYGFTAIAWLWHDDFSKVIRGKIGSTDVPRPKGWDMVLFLGGKALSITWMVVIPLLVAPVGLALLFYFTALVTVGFSLALVFQLAHCVEEAQMLAPGSAEEPAEFDFARLQLATTVDFGVDNRLLTWWVGGLNFQAIHHLFPAISHIHYPALSPIVAEVCAEHGVTYTIVPTARQAMASHYRFLKRMATEPAPAVAATSLREDAPEPEQPKLAA